MERVTHHGRTTAYRRWDRGGDGTPLLCVHGSGGSSSVWSGQSRLADDRPVVGVDLSGHGESDDVDSDAGYETLSAYVDDVLAVADETGARAFVGNSLGGAVLLTMALERDADVGALVLTGTGARLAVLDDLLAWLEGDFERAVEFLHAEDHLFHDPDESALGASRDALHDTGRETTYRDFLTCHRFDVRDDLGGIAAPSLALVGEYDRLTPRSYHEYLADEMPDCELAVVEGAAHLAMLEAPDRFNAAVSAFLARTPDVA
jgi:pimeloyl-ACP methyl ester carboxylesterase